MPDFQCHIQNKAVSTSPLYCNGSAMFTPAQSHSQTLLEHYDYAIVCI